MEVGEGVCETKRIRKRMRIKGSELWKEGSGRVVERKKGRSFVWRRTRSENDLEECRIMQR